MKKKDKNIDTTFYIFLLTIIGYMAAYFTEQYDARYYHYSDQFINITINELIKNNILLLVPTCLFPITVTLIKYLIEDYKKSKQISLSKKKLYLLFIYIIVSTVISSIILYILTSITIMVTMLLIIIAASCYIYYFDQLNFIYFPIILSFLLIFTFFVRCTSGEKSEYDSFYYLGKNYALIKIYDQNIIAKQITENNKSYQWCSDSGITYFKIDQLSGYSFFKVKFNENKETICNPKSLKMNNK